MKIVTNKGQELDIPDLLGGSFKVDLKNVVNENEILDLFDYWRSKMNHPRAKLLPARRKTIEKYLTIYDFDFLKRAIYGALINPWSRGQNPNRTVYDSLNYILCDERIEKFEAIASKKLNMAKKIVKIEKNQEQNKQEYDKWFKDKFGKDPISLEESKKWLENSRKRMKKENA